MITYKGWPVYCWGLSQVTACDTMPIKRKCLIENRKAGNIHFIKNTGSLLYKGGSD